MVIGVVPWGSSARERERRARKRKRENAGCYDILISPMFRERAYSLSEPNCSVHVFGSELIARIQAELGWKYVMACGPADESLHQQYERQYWRTVPILDAIGELRRIVREDESFIVEFAERKRARKPNTRT